MPDIPNVPGVPALASFATGIVRLLLSDALAVLGLFAPARWGIYLNGSIAVEANSVLDFNYKQDWSIADYPVEEGGFQSYDKVQLPYDARVRLVSGSSEAERQAMLTQIEAVANSLELYDIVTPEKVYTSVNVHHYDLKRTATNGVGVIVIDVWFQEVRVTSTAAFSNTQQPVNAGPVASGNVQPQIAPDAIVQKFPSTSID